MKRGTVKTSELGKLLEAAAAGRKVYAPQAAEGDIDLLEWQPGRAVTLDFENVTRSPKRLFFPQCDVLCRFDGETLRDVPLPDEPFVVFGVRPCDARALACLDKIFGEFGGQRDPYYCRRRENAVVVSLACAKPCGTCFCTSVGGDPAGAAGADVAAFPLGKVVLLEAVTAKGEAFLDACGPHLAEPSDSDMQARDEAVQKARAAVAALDVELAALKDKLATAFHAKVWDSIAEVCRGCGLCTYLCPTCHCFDIADETKDGRGRRVRTWDSCQFALFTLHASGHNPRPAKTQRMRQRILHKFLYTVDNLDEVFCVGCGRCVTHCPVNLDIREALKRLAESDTPT
ncbi:MAG: 4Fe-4S dicluster domain-containing protein [Kiritimatiellae bacterium]|nr:4Fe-4S dicluster domain-containing protein [Kiritimatiellia bacterium]